MSAYMMLPILLIHLLLSHLFHLTSAFPSPPEAASPPAVARQITHPPPAFDPYANPNPETWQSNVLCGPSDRTIGFDPLITQRLTAIFCVDLLGYPVSPDETFNATYLPTDLAPLPGKPLAAFSNPHGFSLQLSFVRFAVPLAATYPLNGSLANCASYLNECVEVFERVIKICQWDDHWMGGMVSYSTGCGVWKFRGWNCTKEWEEAGERGGGVGAECVRWVQEVHSQG